MANPAIIESFLRLVEPIISDKAMLFLDNEEFGEYWKVRAIWHDEGDDPDKHDIIYRGEDALKAMEMFIVADERTFDLQSRLRAIDEKERYERERFNKSMESYAHLRASYLKEVKQNG